MSWLSRFRKSAVTGENLEKTMKLCPFNLAPGAALLKLALVASLGHSAAAQNCTFSVTPSDTYVEYSFKTVVMTVTASDPSCTWSVFGNPFWSNPEFFSGRGTTRFGVSFQDNFTGVERSASFTVAGQTVNVTQRATRRRYSDVIASDFFFDPANFLFDKHIVASCVPGSLAFCPSASVSRGEAAFMFTQAILGQTIDPYPEDSGFSFGAWQELPCFA